MSRRSFLIPLVVGISISLGSNPANLHAFTKNGLSWASIFKVDETAHVIRSREPLEAFEKRIEGIIAKNQERGETASFFGKSRSIVRQSIKATFEKLSTPSLRR